MLMVTQAVHRVCPGLQSDDLECLHRLGILLRHPVHHLPPPVPRSAGVFYWGDSHFPQAGSPLGGPQLPAGSSGGQLQVGVPCSHNLQCMLQCRHACSTCANHVMRCPCAQIDCTAPCPNRFLNIAVQIYTLLGSDEVQAELDNGQLPPVHATSQHAISALTAMRHSCIPRS